MTQHTCHIISINKCLGINVSLHFWGIDLIRLDASSTFLDIFIAYCVRNVDQIMNPFDCIHSWSNNTMWHLIVQQIGEIYYTCIGCISINIQSYFCHFWHTSNGVTFCQPTLHSGASIWRIINDVRLQRNICQNEISHHQYIHPTNDWSQDQTSLFVLIYAAAQIDENQKYIKW